MKVNPKFIQNLKLDLFCYGEYSGDFMPWHSSNDPYEWFIAECLLKLTTRKVVEEVYIDFIRKVPSFTNLAETPVEVISTLITKIGLQNQKAEYLCKVAKIVTFKYGGHLPHDREELLSLPGVGLYIADALRLHIFGYKTLPVDSNLLRLFRRILGLPIANNTRRTDPYRDFEVINICNQLLQISSSYELKYIHRGILLISSDFCKFHPICEACIFKAKCVYNQISKY